MSLMERLNKVTTGSRNVLIVCATVMFCVVIAGAFGIARIEQDSSVAATLITIMFGSLATTIAALATVIKAESIKAQVSEIKSDTNDLLNGKMDAKLSAAVKRELTLLLEEHLPSK